MVEAYIQKGEAILVYSDTAFADRIITVQKDFGTHSDVIIYSEEKMKIDTVRDFVYDLQKESMGGLHGVSKVGILICDDIALPAQHALLKVLEDIDPAACIIIYAHSESVFLSTILSRVIVAREKNSANKKTDIEKYGLNGKTVAERLEQVKKVMKAYDDEKLTKQDIIQLLDIVKGNTEAYTRALSMLKQPSVSVKYVLEYIAAVL
ncbi:MAG: hypothetical protein V4576_04470 [Patescibacteria group bacterium]